MSRYPTEWRGPVRHRSRDVVRHPDGRVTVLLGVRPVLAVPECPDTPEPRPLLSAARRAVSS
jgi:hypothetical protein